MFERKHPLLIYLFLGMLCVWCCPEEQFNGYLSCLIYVHIVCANQTTSNSYVNQIKFYYTVHGQSNAIRSMGEFNIVFNPSSELRAGGTHNTCRAPELSQCHDQGPV